MPTYVYKCKDCECPIEVLHGMNEEGPSTCECGGPLARVLQSFTPHYKGTGFYTTDYGRSK